MILFQGDFWSLSLVNDEHRSSIAVVIASAGGAAVAAAAVPKQL